VTSKIRLDEWTEKITQQLYMNSRARALDELRKMMLLAASSLDDIQKEIADRKHLKI
jgi:glucan phosphorylase